MNARIEDAKPVGRLRRVGAPVLHGLARGLLLLTGLAVTVLGFTRYVDAYDGVGAPRHAPTCGTAAAAPGADCLRHETGKVTAGRVDNSNDAPGHWLTVARETAGEHEYPVGKAFYDDVEVGTDVDVTVFRGRVAEVSYRGHRARNPSTPWLASTEIALLVGLGSALTAYGLTRARPATEATPVGIAAFITFLSFFGNLVLVSTQLPLAVTLAVPALAWLALTAGSTAAARNG
ncbi:hypothetical protein ACFV0O_36560 [Kitasatospora sp. NPDC059577]|uniref:hypothetical protein n=1 Tax=Kitasatospora sp. NPDC059577 TaxID=3346873 RepID=UPI0036C83770